jgi:DNA-3-methyladenine glycosylase I
MPDRPRCTWAEGDDDLMRRYHDEEWGVPVRDGRVLFEFLTLEGAQAGLSWRTILHRREGYRAAFHGWDIQRIAAMTPADVERLLQDSGIIRHRGKVESTIQNAQATVALGGAEALSALAWEIVGGTPRRNRWSRLEDLPAETEESRTLSKALRKAGFRFVGPTTAYAFMQACGLVDDHLPGCFRA